jgi:hypothetical protein
MFEKLQSLLPEVIEDAIGDKMCCKILFFVGRRKPNGMSVMLECVTKDSMDEVTHRRSSMEYELVRQCPSPDFFLPVNQRIRVSVAGKFALTKHIGKGYYFLTFFPIAADNFICFPVDRHTGMGSPAYGIISFNEDNGTKKDLHAIHYDPWSSRGKPQGNPKMPSTKSTPFSRLVTAATDEQRNRLDTNFDESMYKNFFTNELTISITHFNIKNSVVFKKVLNRIKCKKGVIRHTKGIDVRPIITKSCVFKSSRTISGRSFRWVCILNGEISWGLLCLTSLLAIFQLYRCGQFFYRRKPEYLVKTTDLPQVTDKLYSIMLYRVHLP